MPQKPQTNTPQCKNFLAGFFCRNPQIIDALMGANTPPNDRITIMTLALQANCWKRVHRCRPGCGDYEIQVYTMYEDGTQVNRWADPVPVVKRGADDFVVERCFVCAPNDLEDMIKFIVLEDKDGNLHVGDYVGD